MEVLEAEIGSALVGERLDRALCILFGLPRSAAALAIQQDRVTLRGIQAKAASARVASGDVVRVFPQQPDASAPAPPAALSVVYEDESIIVLDKDAGVVVHPGAGNASGTLAQALARAYPEIASVGDPDRPGIVHRLDKNTSGLLVVARSQVAYDALVNQLRDRKVQRSYLAVVRGVQLADTGRIDAPIARSKRQPTKMTISASGKEARSTYRVQERFPSSNASLVEVSLETGRTHQIRVHMMAIGHPVLGDDRYGGRDPRIGRPFLHAWSLGLDHPVTGKRCQWQSELPRELGQILETLRSEEDQKARH